MIIFYRFGFLVLLILFWIVVAQQSGGLCAVCDLRHSDWYADGWLSRGRKDA
jgi:hypothetical protein